MNPMSCKLAKAYVPCLVAYGSKNYVLIFIMIINRIKPSPVNDPLLHPKKRCCWNFIVTLLKLKSAKDGFAMISV